MGAYFLFVCNWSKGCFLTNDFTLRVLQYLAGAWIYLITCERVCMCCQVHSSVQRPVDEDTHICSACHPQPAHIWLYSGSGRQQGTAVHRNAHILHYWCHMIGQLDTDTQIQYIFVILCEEIHCIFTVTLLPFTLHPLLFLKGCKLRSATNTNTVLNTSVVCSTLTQ